MSFRNFWKKFNIFEKGTTTEQEPFDFDRMVLDLQEGEAKKGVSLSKSELRDIDRLIFKDRVLKKESNPFAICSASVGREDQNKYEDCVQEVKAKIGYTKDSPLDDTAHGALHVDNTGGKWEDSENRLVDPFDSSTGFESMKAEKVGREISKYWIKVYSSGNKSLVENKTNLNVKEFGKLLETYKNHYLPIGYKIEVGNDSGMHEVINKSQSFSKGFLENEIKQAKGTIDMIDRKIVECVRDGDEKGMQEWNKKKKEYQGKLERLARLKDMNREKSIRKETDATTLGENVDNDNMAIKSADEGMVTMIEDWLLEGISLADAIKLAYEEFQDTASRQEIDRAIARAKQETGTKKDVGISYAGPVPASGLAEQDLEGGSTTTKSRTKAVHDLHKGEVVKGHGKIISIQKTNFTDKDKGYGFNIIFADGHKVLWKELATIEVEDVKKSINRIIAKHLDTFFKVPLMHDQDNESKISDVKLKIITLNNDRFKAQQNNDQRRMGELDKQIHQLEQQLKQLGGSWKKSQVDKHHLEDEIEGEQSDHDHYMDLASKNPSEASTLETIANEEANHKRELEALEYEEESSKKAIRSIISKHLDTFFKDEYNEDAHYIDNETVNNRKEIINESTLQ
jgi:hypothetical protein